MWASYAPGAVVAHCRMFASDAHEKGVKTSSIWRPRCQKSIGCTANQLLGVYSSLELHLFHTAVLEYQGAISVSFAFDGEGKT